MIYITKMNKNGLVENCHIPQYKEDKISRRRIKIVLIEHNVCIVIYTDVDKKNYCCPVKLLSL